MNSTVKDKLKYKIYNNEIEISNDKIELKTL